MKTEKCGQNQNKLLRGKYGKEAYYEEECRSQEILNNFIEENEVVLCVNCILASYSVHEFLKFYVLVTFSSDDSEFCFYWNGGHLFFCHWVSAIYQHRSILLVFHILFDKMRRHNILRGLHIIILENDKQNPQCMYTLLEGSRNIDLWPLTWNRPINIQSQSKATH